MSGKRISRGYSIDRKENGLDLVQNGADVQQGCCRFTYDGEISSSLAISVLVDVECVVCAVAVDIDQVRMCMYSFMFFTCVNPFSSAVPISGQTTLIPSGLSRKWDCSAKRVIYKEPRRSEKKK